MISITVFTMIITVVTIIIPILAIISIISLAAQVTSCFRLQLGLRLWRPVVLRKIRKHRRSEEVDQMVLQQKVHQSSCRMLQTHARFTLRSVSARILQL